MLKKLRSNKGFTLIELLIVVAIIGILAAIAIPQFAAYRMRGYNSTALSDMKNTKTAEESLYADQQCYGETDVAAALLTAAIPASGTGNILMGPMAAAVGGAAPVAGGRISGLNSSGASGAIPIGLSNGVNLIAITSAAASGEYNSYEIFTRHEMADTAYGSDSDNTTVTYRVTNPAWAGVVNVISATMPAPTVGVDNMGPNNTVNGGGAPTVNWTIM
jgi:type IV pilus assembly protein PilA